MKRAMFTSAVALIASVALTDSAMADTLGPDFTFAYATSYGTNGLSQPYSATTSTGGSYGTGVAVQSTDPSQKTYSLVEANANIGVGGCKACVPVQGRTIASSSTTPSYLGEYSIVRRTSSGNIDKAFGDKGYVTAFPTSDDESYRFTSLCIDPGTSKIVLTGQQTTADGTVGVVERLNPPATGSGTATLDTTFNAGGPTPGVVTVSTPDGLNDPALYNCAVTDNGAGHNGTIVASGIDDSSAASMVLAAKITGSGTPDAGFGTDG
ncbi:MAG: hypothetical protein QOF98_170, partial [Streptomyces sp.]|nr:hypothetical protein [Streptomyces sp.]